LLSGIVNFLKKYDYCGINYPHKELILIGSKTEKIKTKSPNILKKLGLLII